MDAKDTRNPAFPITAGNQVYNIGMTLRDWFAGQALAGMSHALNEGDVEWIRQHGAKAAYAMADAMLEARK